MGAAGRETVLGSELNANAKKYAGVFKDRLLYK